MTHRTTDKLLAAVRDYDAASGRRDAHDGVMDAPLTRARLNLVLALLDSGWAPESPVMAQAVRDVSSLGPDLLDGVDLDELLHALRHVDDLQQRDLATALQLQEFLTVGHQDDPEVTPSVHLSRVRDWRLASAAPLTWAEFARAVHRLAPGLGRAGPSLSDGVWVMPSGRVTCTLRYGQVDVVGPLEDDELRLLTGVAERLFGSLSGPASRSSPEPGPVPQGWAGGLRRALRLSSPAPESSAVILRYRSQVLVGARHLHRSGTWMLDQHFEQLAWGAPDAHLAKAISLGLQRARAVTAPVLTWKDVHGAYARAAGAYDWQDFEQNLAAVKAYRTAEGTDLSVLGLPEDTLHVPSGRGEARAVAKAVIAMLGDDDRGWSSPSTS